MRRNVALVLFALGVSLIVLAIALPNYVYPRVAKAPVDPDRTMVAQGQGVTVLLPRSIEDGGTQIYRDQTVTQVRKVNGMLRQGAPVPEDNERFYRNAVRTDVEGKGLLEAYVEAGSFDMTTGLATNCCGDFRSDEPGDDIGEPVVHSGLLYKFPFNTKRRDYQFWDETIKAATTARFDGTEDIHGLQTYRFVQVVQPTVIGQQDVPGELIGVPDTPTLTADRIFSTRRTIWVEPYTGAIIKGAQQVDQRLVAEEGQAPIINGYMEYTPDTVRRNVDEYASAAQGLRFVSRIGPLGGWILGPILLIAGALLLVTERRRPGRRVWEEEPTRYATV
jgi:hypothetical protein